MYFFITAIIASGWDVSMHCNCEWVHAEILQVPMW